MTDQAKELRRACELVERYCRELGRNCEVIFTRHGVEVAPTSWPGSSTGANLFEALWDALAHDKHELPE